MSNSHFCGTGLGLVAIALLLASAGGMPASTEQATAVERKIVSHVNAHVEDAVALLERAVNINSGTMNVEGVRKVGQLFLDELSKIGFDSRWVDGAAVKRAGHVFAERKGDRGKRLLLLGHLDTVFEADSPFQRFERRGGRATGPGASDMKGGIVVILQALKALQAAGALDGARIVVMLTGDEEDAGSPVSLARAAMIEAARRSDVALSFEAAVGGTDNATIGRRGSSDWRLRVKGVGGHSARIFNDQYGAGAIFETARILNAFYEELRGEEYLVFSPGTIVGGTETSFDAARSVGTAFGKSNVIAGTAFVNGNMRFISEEQHQRARERMRAIVARSLPRTSAEIEFDADYYPAMSPSQGNYRLLASLDQVSRDLGYGAVKALDPASRGAGDIAFVSSIVDSLDGLGAPGEGAHSDQESIDLTTLPVMTARAAVLMHRLTQAAR